jgi:hypothetical protein
LRTPDEAGVALEDPSTTGVAEVCLWPLARNLDEVDRIAGVAQGHL